MEKASQIAMMANTEVIKEPRGFIKFIQIVLAIFAFATTTAYVGMTSFEYQCPKCSDNSTTTAATPTTVALHFWYSFQLNDASNNVSITCCGSTTSLTRYGSFKSSSEFYVFVGVMAFLYSLAAVILYVFADDKYRQLDYLPCADLVITAVFVLLWLISSSAWAEGLTQLKHYSAPTTLFNGTATWNDADYSVNITDYGSYASLNVSIIFGFLNMAVWGGNIWFLYKETKWFSDSPDNIPPQQQQQQQGSPESPQQRI